ncbi:MAG: hypothetical protein AAF171_17515 [Cyanobacteria bacterium P01_A01_bin.116]
MMSVFRSCLISGCFTTGLLLLSASVAQASLVDVDTDSFRRVDQSLGVKTAVTTVGIGLIGLELWWFLWHKAQAFSQRPISVGAKRAEVTPAQSLVLAQLPDDKVDDKVALEDELIAPPEKSQRPKSVSLTTYDRLRSLPYSSFNQSFYANMQKLQFALMVEDNVSPRFSVISAS